MDELLLFRLLFRRQGVHFFDDFLRLPPHFLKLRAARLHFLTRRLVDVKKLRLAALDTGNHRMKYAVELLLSGVYPRLYNTSEEVRSLAIGLIRIGALFMPVYAYVNAAYFIIRSGGKTVVTFFFDSVYSWVVVIPAVFVAAHFTGLPLYALFLIVQLTEVIKCFIGHFLVKRGAWAVNLTRYGQAV